ncbi:sulfatase-like hydrolase/transferase [Rubritalea marina]|uniref:sulfatase-like hydrolase/transferase n=1 Tax=Rubritalea marina TaxID=361055 RepID=UPI00037BDA3F|nr:sulfatase-like hydrolase/transferase [Rubritalea marina]
MKTNAFNLDSLLGISLLHAACVGLLLGSNLSTKAKSAQQPNQPNVIFVFSDDQRYDSLGMTGDPITQTPHLNQLAADGVFFDQAFVTSPICGPSRANIFTGQWERKNRIGFNFLSKNIISQEVFENSFLMQLKQAGYSTAFLGKHHTKIVDRNNTPLRDHIDFCYFAEGHLGFHPAKKHKEFSNLKNTSQTEGLFEATKAYLATDEDFDYFYKNADPKVKASLKKRDPKKPFCAWVNLNLPHQSSLGGMGSLPSDPEFYSTLYEEKQDQIIIPRDTPLFPDEVLSIKKMPGYYRLKGKALRNTKLKTARAVFGIDQYIKNLRDLLVQIGESENTIIIFCSDNGLIYGEHGISGKSMLYEESVHVPLIIYSPFMEQSKAGQRLDSLVVGQDIPATILDMCGLDVPDTYQGKSMVPLLEGDTSNWRNDVFFENLFTDQEYPRAESVRGEKFKYIRYFSRENDRKQYLPDASINGEKPIYEELFDLSKDPKEQVNLATNPEYSSVLAAQRKRCQTLVEELAN